MGNLATTYLQQARSFLRAGNPEKAVELLEKAKVLTGNDRQVEKQVLEAMAEACSATGRYDQANRCRQRLAALFPPPPAQSTGAGTISLPLSQKRKWPLVIGATAAAMVLLGCAVVVAVVIMQGRTRPEPFSQPLVLSQLSPTSAPAAVPNQPRVSSGSAGVASTLPTVVAAAPSSAPAATPPATASPTVIASATTPPTTTAPTPPVPSIDKQALFKDTVGMVVAIARYEGTDSGRQVQYDLAFGTGTAFAINSSGIMLTNRHVTEAMRNPDIPPTLQGLGLPTFVLRERLLLVCFGPDAKDHYVAGVLHESPNFDMAVLKVDRKFNVPLAIASASCKQGDTIYACGYPGVVRDMLNAGVLTPSRIDQIRKKLQTSTHWQDIDAFSSDVFDSTLTKGIVSAPERNFRGVAYLQTDAAIREGNSGGPALNERNEVVGIMTLGILDRDTKAVTNYNLALLMDQLRDEIAGYLPKR